MTDTTDEHRYAGLDFGTTNSVAALTGEVSNAPYLLSLNTPDGPAEVWWISR